MKCKIAILFCCLYLVLVNVDILNVLHWEPFVRKMVYYSGLAFMLTFAVIDRFCFKITAYWHHVANLVSFCSVIGNSYLVIFSMMLMTPENDYHKMLFGVFNFSVLSLSLLILHYCKKNGVFKTIAR